MFVPPPIVGSSAKAVRTLADDRRMNIADVYWETLAAASEETRFAKVDLLAASAVLMTDPGKLEGRLTEHAFTLSHGGRWIRLVARERGGKHEKVLKYHAEDEERHGLQLLQLLRDLGHDVSDDVLGPPDHIGPRCMDLHQRWGQDLYTFLCFVHAAEVRTMFHVQHILHISAAFADERMARVNETFAAIYADDKFHVRYSAQLLGHMMEAGRDPSILRAAFDAVHHLERGIMDMGPPLGSLYPGAENARAIEDSRRLSP